MLVRFGCGCIGLPEPLPTGDYLIVKPCGDYDGRLVVMRRDFSDETLKTLEGLSEEDELAVWSELGSLVAAGYDLGAIRGLLRGRE